MTTRCATILLAATFIGCAPAAQDQPDSGPSGGRVGTLPDAPPSITGTVTAIGRGHLRIETNPQEESGSAKAQVRVPDAVAILDRSGVARRFDDIRQGQVVSAWFIGPVAESYPVQATASVVVIEPPTAPDSTAHVSGFGPVHAGMTLAEAEREAHADSSYRMIFETDGMRVTKYRVGRLPEVRWVEGCS